MKLRFVDVLANELVVVWDDGHESYYPADRLRRACPCASCSGESDLFGRISKGPDQPYSPSAFELRGADQIGNYGIQPTWGDGHVYGIWTLEKLRAACPCNECAGRRIS